MITEEKQWRRGRHTVVVGIGGNSWRGGARRGFFWGILIVLIGIVVLLGNMGVITASHFYRYWPMILVAFGLLNLLSASDRSLGFLALIVGVFLQLRNLGLIHLTWGIFWGLLLITVGVLVIWTSVIARKLPTIRVSDSGDLKTTINEAAIFGGVERRITTQDFQGGCIKAVFGGVEIDLSGANMQRDEATLELKTIFGGVELRVPPSWRVVTRTVSIFGGIADKTRSARTEDESDPNRKTLVLTGAMIFGGVEIKN